MKWYKLTPYKLQTDLTNHTEDPWTNMTTTYIHTNDNNWTGGRINVFYDSSKWVR